ncbi:MAG TPA: GntR family transcriptional regulator [Clostridiales bacterium]|nr:GntR family transcriptional regulator [Clostridiales bacterium]
MMALNSEEVHYQRSLGGQVFEQIRENILNGRYKPGESLIELRLSEEIGVSRTPIREAIRQLELEGLVHVVPNKGAIVSGVSDKDVDDIYTIRMLVEGLAAQWAAQNITDRELEELEEILELEDFYTRKKDSSHILQIDSRFHQVIFAASKSKSLMHVLGTFHQYVRNARNTSLSYPDRAAEALKEHTAIYEAIRIRDSEKAGELMTDHIMKARASLNLRKQTRGDR